MRTLILTAIMLVGLTTQAQKSATFEQVGNKKVRGMIDSYTTQSGVTFHIGDTLKIGRPYANEHFDFLINRSNMWLGAAAGDPTAMYVNVSQSGHMAVIKSMKTTQRKLYVTTYAKGESVGINISNFEEAFNVGEIMLPNYISSDEALDMLKREKDKFDLGLITEEEFLMKRKELSKLIK